MSLKFERAFGGEFTGFEFLLGGIRQSSEPEWRLTMAKWECSACGFIYDPHVGDPERGIKAGTPFEDLPDSWFCPNCGVGKEFFEIVQ